MFLNFQGIKVSLLVQCGNFQGIFPFIWLALQERYLLKMFFCIGVEQDLHVVFLFCSGVHRSRDGNGPGRRVKRQFCSPAHPSKSHIRLAWFIPPSLKISAHPAYGPNFSGPARHVLQCNFLKSTEKHIFLAFYIVNLKIFKILSCRFYCYESTKFYFILIWFF
jgi:hypothetical protein